MPKKRHSSNKQKRRKKPIHQKLVLWLSQKTKETKESLFTLFIFLVTGALAAFLFLIIHKFFGFNILEWIQTIPYIYPAISTIVIEIKTGSALGILYLFSLSSIFFIPTPLEILFFTLLKTSNLSLLYLGTATVAGLLIGQHINYLLGRIFGKIIKGFIKKKTRSSITKKLRHYGAYAIFIINLIFFPYPLANFIFGMVKYPYHKWLAATTLAFVVKLAIIYIIFLYI
ncbi:hypothetical protein HOC01_04010 [archaeon]|jgi:membrane protein DedA with SNARE-associated domain|nr:hypothetical protein [archaeon]MBT6698423.1 hypothetical protein [archaeon]